MSKHREVEQEVYINPRRRSVATIRELWDTTANAGADSLGRAGRTVHAFVGVHVKQTTGRVYRHTLHDSEWKGRINEA